MTDTLGLLVADGRARAPSSVADDPLEAEGVNTRVELAAAAAALRDRINEAHMLAGVTIVDPASTWIDAGVEIEPDVVVHPFTVHPRRTVRIAHAASTRDRRRAVGRSLPAPEHGARRGREGRHVRRGQERPRSARGTKIPHLSYVGDAEVGEDTNVAAGNITANFAHEPGAAEDEDADRQQRQDRRRQRTFVAPVEIGDDAWIAPGAVITDDVPAGALAGFAPRQVTKEGWVYEKHGKPDGD